MNLKVNLLLSMMICLGTHGALIGQVTEKQANESGKKVFKTDAEWKRQLSAIQYYVTRQQGTERAFTGKYWNVYKEGTYKCVCCGQELFDSKTKFKSGTGWPSFYQPIDKKNLKLLPDNTLFTTRTEVKCKRCDAHIGHVFEDGPKPTGLRYCMNSAALDFEAAKPPEVKSVQEKNDASSTKDKSDKK